MKFWYNVLFTIFFLISSPYYFWKMWRRGNWREGFGQRMGDYDSRIKHSITNRDVIWIHAVSVGEVNIATHLIQALESRAPNLKIVVSTTTSTGMGELRKKLPPQVEKIYYPVDRKAYVSRALRVLKPEAIVLVEAEIWPNFLWTARSRGIPTFLVNARMSERSFRGYKRFGLLFRPIFRGFSGVGAQNDHDAQRLIELGCRERAVRVVGNLKFDAARLSPRSNFDAWAMLKQLGVEETDPILVAGSTHAGEEAVLARAFRTLRAEFPRLFLVVVPRHFERGREAAKDLEREGLRLVYRSEVSSSLKLARGETDCLLVNSTGELRFFYETATAIFVGKSLCGEGGQNPIEPGALGKAMVFGPNMQNFQSIAESFVSSQGAAQVQTEEELIATLRELLGNPEKREALGRNALRVVQENRGSIQRTVELIIEHLKQDVFIPAAK